MNTNALAQGRSRNGHLNELFCLEEKGTQLNSGVQSDRSAACGGQLQGSSSRFSAVMTSSEEQPATISDRNIEVPVEVLDVWIDESDGTTGSSNSTGVAARDLLRLCDLAHSCTKSNETLRACLPSSAFQMLCMPVTPWCQALT